MYKRTRQSSKTFVRFPHDRHSGGIWAIGLEKSYGDARVLDGVDLRIPTGTIYALLGPNGAGKTTTVRILSTLLQADAGQARGRVRRGP